jgi:hypothetical protein
MNQNAPKLGNIEIQNDWFRLLLGSTGSVLFTVGSWLIVSHRIGDISPDDYRYWVVWACVPFFGACSILWIWVLLHTGETVIRITPDAVWLKHWGRGITIPWNMVKGVSRSSEKGGRFLLLAVSQEDYQVLFPGKIEVAMRMINKSLGADGVVLNRSGTTASIDMLESWVLRYWNEWKEQHSSSVNSASHERKLQDQ